MGCNLEFITSHPSAIWVVKMIEATISLVRNFLFWIFFKEKKVKENKVMANINIKDR
jgi:hypothetical protein